MEIIKNDTVYRLYQQISKFFFEKPKIISTFFNPKICYSSIFERHKMFLILQQILLKFIIKDQPIKQTTLKMVL